MTIYDQIAWNKRKTFLVVAFFIAFISFISYIFGEANGYGLSFGGLALIISGLLSFGSYYYSDRIILGISGARPADPKTDFDFYSVTENLCLATGLPKPKLYVIDDTAPNAFATGRDPNHAVVCATTGILSKLNRAELEGVIAHELSHVRNFDIRLMGIVSILVGTVALLADLFLRSLWFEGKNKDRDRGGGIFILVGIVLAIISPIIAALIQLAISRRREFLADASGVLITRNPIALARALEKISSDKEVLEVATNATAHMYIINPFKGKNFGAWFAGFFDTHPAVEERIRILRSM